MLYACLLNKRICFQFLLHVTSSFWSSTQSFWKWSFLSTWKEKSWTNYKSTFLRSVSEVRPQNKSLPQNLDRQSCRHREPQRTRTETHTETSTGTSAVEQLGCNGLIAGVQCRQVWQLKTPAGDHSQDDSHPFVSLLPEAYQAFTVKIEKKSLLMLWQRGVIMAILT